MDMVKGFALKAKEKGSAVAAAAKEKGSAKKKEPKSGGKNKPSLKAAAASFQFD